MSAEEVRDALIESVKLDVRNSMRSDPNVWHQALESALDMVLPTFWDAARAAVLAEQGEPEWEYGVTGFDPTKVVSPRESLHGALESQRYWRDVIGAPSVVMQRMPGRKAGPWLPVEESGESE